MMVSSLPFPKTEIFVLKELGFKVGPCDICVTNEMTNDKQCAVLLHADDLDVPHKDTEVMVQCAKSHRPFELFANENCELWNEAKMNAMFERGSAQDLSAQSSLC